MVDLTWPERLPLPTYQGYGLEAVDAIARTDMEAGPARQRRRYTQTPVRLSVRWRFSAWQFAIFEAWFRHDAREGGAWFRIQLLGGLGLDWHEARFTGSGSAPYRAVPTRGNRTGAAWTVEATLEVRKRPALSKAVLDVAASEDMDGLLAAMDRLHGVVHMRLPGGNGWN